MSLSFELERVLDRNIGIESPGSGAVSMGILSILTGVYGEGKRNYVYSVEFFCVNLFFTPPASYICKIKDSTVLSNNLRYNQYYEKDESSSIDNSAYFDDLL